jgi:uracil-DNA glycosylase family 4
MRLIQWIPKTPSKIVIVGEAPGQQEHLQGIPFIGPEVLNEDAFYSRNQ